MFAFYCPFYGTVSSPVCTPMCNRWTTLEMNLDCPYTQSDWIVLRLPAERHKFKKHRGCGTGGSFMNAEVNDSHRICYNAWFIKPLLCCILFNFWSVSIFDIHDALWVEVWIFPHLQMIGWYMCAQGLSNVLGRNSGVTSPHWNKEKVHINLPANSFRGTAPPSPKHNTLDFYLCRHLKILLCSPPIINEDTVQRRISAVC